MFSLSSRVFTALGLCLLAGSASAGNVIYADAGLNTGLGDGSSWDNAFQGTFGLQDALDVAVAGDQVFVAQGLYLPANVGQRAVSFRMVTDIEIYGGFLGGEASPDERPAGATSTLSGDLAGDDGSGAVGENSYHVVRANATDPSALLDGFLVMGGNSNSGGNNDTGGGVLCLNSANATFRGCRFVGNRCTFGGGAGYINGSQPTFIECTFEDNIGGSFGGAFDIATAGTVTFDRCLFIGNTANRAGALEVFATSGVVVTNSVFVGNTATGGGGGGAIWIGSGSNTYIGNCTVVGNSATSQTAGGIRVEGSAPVIVNTIAYDNSGPGGAQNSANQITPNENVTYSIVEGGYTGTGNLSGDPGFVGGGDFSLTLASPAIDAGNNSGVPAGADIDFAGNDRFVDEPSVVDTGAGSAPVVDIGAHEFPVDAITAFCFGDGSGTACPCANPGGAGEGCANSTASGASFSAAGSISVAADDLVFTNASMAPFQPALCFVGTTTLSGGDGAVFGDGLRCVGGQVVRLGIVAADAGGTATWGPGLGALGGWMAGDTRYFQAWYRDPAGPCGAAFNLSNALEATFQP